MLQFKVGDKVIVNNKLDCHFDDSEGEKKLIGQVGVIIEANEEGVYPYQVKFDNDEIQKLNLNMGSRLFDEFELDSCR